jgi:hypothetical protein
MKVRCTVSDSKIWNTSEFTAALVYSAVKDGSITVEMNKEGPCCETSGINQILRNVIQLTEISPDNVTIETGNFLPSSPYKEIHLGIWDLLKNTIKFDKDAYKVDQFTKKMGIFIGRSNWMRLGIASYIWDKHRDDSLITFHYDRSHDFHIANFGLEELLGRHYEDRDVIYRFLDALPLKLDSAAVYPITHTTDVNSWNLLPYYQTFFCDVVCETFFSGTTFFYTEKIIRPILARRPFLVQGPKYFLKNLKRMGFKTFDQWWDEGYDEDPSDCRYETFKQNISYIAGQPLETLQQWYQEMQPTLEHNYNLLQTFSDDKIKATFYGNQDK